MSVDKSPPPVAAFRAIAAFVFSFGLAKGLAFLAAIALPRLVNAELYGLIELAMTCGVLAAYPVGVGLPAAATRLALVDNDPRARTMLALHAVWLAVVGLVAAAALAIAGYGGAVVACAAILGFYGFQFSTSSYTRIYGHIRLSGWFDNVTILLVFVVAAMLAIWDRGNLLFFVWAIIAMSLLFAMLAGFALAQSPMDRIVEAMSSALRVGVPAMFYGASSLLIFATPRLAMARSLTLNDVACFSLFARLTLVLVFLNQLLVTGFFRRLYQMRPEDFDRIYSLWIVVLSTAALIMTIAGLYAAPLLVAGTEIPVSAVATIFPAVAVQTTLWVLNTNLEIFVVRELRSHQASIAFVIVAAAGLAAGLGLAHLGLLDLTWLLAVYSVAMFVVLVAQMRLLADAGLAMARSYVVLPLAGAPWLMAAALPWLGLRLPGGS